MDKKSGPSVDRIDGEQRLNVFCLKDYLFVLRRGFGYDNIRRDFLYNARALCEPAQAGYRAANVFKGLLCQPLPEGGVDDILPVLFSYCVKVSVFQRGQEPYLPVRFFLVTVPLSRRGGKRLHITFPHGGKSDL